MTASARVPGLWEEVKLRVIEMRFKQRIVGKIWCVPRNPAGRPTFVYSGDDVDGS